MLDRLDELSVDELNDLETKVISEFESVESQEQTPQTVEQMVALADALDSIRAAQSRQQEQLAELSRQAEEAVSRVKGAADESGEDAGEPEGSAAEDNNVEAAAAASADNVSEPAAPVDGSEAQADEPQAAESNNEETPSETPAEAESTDEDESAASVADESEAADQGAPEQTTEDSAEKVENADEQDATAADSGTEDPTNEQEEAVTAAAENDKEREPDVQAPADRTPQAKVTYEAPVSITAGADIPGVSAGSPLGGMSDIAKAMADRMHQMRRTSGGDGEQHTVATLVASFPEERTLKSTDPEGNTEKVKAAVSPTAITAAGGICAPVNVRYDLYDIGGSVARPVRDALAPFNADRGGIRFVTPPVLGDLAGAVSLWTLQDDIDAATAGAPDPVKPCIRVNCGDEVTVYTDAIPLCLTFGNLNARAYPELVARHNELALVQHARFAETRLLTRIGTLSTDVTAARQLGAVIDFLVTVDRAQAAYRSRHRLESNSPLRVVAPAWVMELMRADLAKRMPGDGMEANLAVADAQINAFFRSRNINVTWTLDGEAGQVFGAQAAGALLDFPDNVVWYMFAEGTFLFLDGGTLDLGLVRDSTLNGTNDYKMFVETFEGVAKVGIESLRITSRLEPTGQVAGTVDTTPA